MSTLQKEMGLWDTRRHTWRLFYILFPLVNSRPGQWLHAHCKHWVPCAVSCEKERSACSRLQPPTSETLCIPISLVSVLLFAFFSIFFKLIWRSAFSGYQFWFSYLFALSSVQSVSRLFIYLLMNLTLFNATYCWSETDRKIVLYPLHNFTGFVNELVFESER